jgi:hypothetical protein
MQKRAPKTTKKSDHEKWSDDCVVSNRGSGLGSGKMSKKIKPSKKDKDGVYEPLQNKDGYMITVIEDGTELYNHHLGAAAFVHNPSGCKYARHIDGNKRNNSARNLEWTDADPMDSYSEWVRETERASKLERKKQETIEGARAAFYDMKGDEEPPYNEEAENFYLCTVFYVDCYHNDDPSKVERAKKKVSRIMKRHQGINVGPSMGPPLNSSMTKGCNPAVKLVPLMKFEVPNDQTWLVVKELTEIDDVTFGFPKLAPDGYEYFEYRNEDDRSRVKVRPVNLIFAEAFLPNPDNNIVYFS